MLTRIRDGVRRRPVVAFSVLVLALSWPMLLLGGEEASPTLALGILGAGGCAFLVTWLADGAAGVRELAGRALQWRVPARWYLLALFGIPAAYLAVGYAVTAALFPANLALPSVNGLISITLSIVPLFVMLLMVEEFGWRGFVLPRLQHHMSPLAASLVVGLLWFAWHLPLFLGGSRPMHYLPPLFIGIIPYAVILTWVFNRTGGSVVLVTLMHAAGNAWNAHVYAPMFGADPVLFEYLRVGVYTLVAIAVLALTRGRLGGSSAELVALDNRHDVVQEPQNGGSVAR